MYRSLGLLSLFYVWLYDGYPLLFLVAAAFFLAGVVVEKRADFRVLAYVVMGITAGVVINPYFPANISSLFYNLSRTLFLDAPGISLGNEWKPYNTWALLRNSLPAFVAFFAVFFAGYLRKKNSVLVVVSLLLNLLFFILTLKSRRFVEYWPVFAVLNAALVYGRNPLPAGRYLFIGFLLISPLLTYNVREAYREVAHTPNPTDYQGAASWLQENSLPETIVFNADWDDFPFLFFYNSSNYYIVGLDPMYLYSYDQQKSRRYKEITRGRLKMPVQTIREEFRAEFVYLDKKHRSFLTNLQDDSQAEKVYEDKYGYIFSVAAAK